MEKFQRHSFIHLRMTAINSSHMNITFYVKQNYIFQNKFFFVRRVLFIVFANLMSGLIDHIWVFMSSLFLAHCNNFHHTASGKLHRALTKG